MKLLAWCFILAVLVIYFTGCAPKDDETPCGKPNQYRCVNLCDGLFVKRQSNWSRYYENELDCNVERNQIFERYD